MNKINILSLFFSLIVSSFGANIFENTLDTKPYAMQAYGMREAGAISEDTIRLVIGASITGSAENAKSYRIVSSDDTNYLYNKFVNPISVKKVREHSIREFIAPEGYSAPEAGNFRVLSRTVLDITLPTKMKAGAKYTIIGLGVGNEVVTAGKTAASFVYEPNKKVEIPSKESKELASCAIGLRNANSLGDGFIVLEFGAGYSPEGGKVLSNYDITINGKKVVPQGVGRRSLIDIYMPVGWPYRAYLYHRVFLNLGTQLKDGDKLVVKVAESITSGNRETSLNFSEKKSISQSIKVNQVGYLPDAIKIAKLGQWFGSYPEEIKKEDKSARKNFSNADIYGFTETSEEEKPTDEENKHSAFYNSLAIHALRFEEPPKFSICDAKTGKEVWSGQSVLSKKGNEIDLKVNHSAENSFDLDFTSFNKPGEYFISIPGVGRSYSFKISPKIYDEVFDISAYGVFIQRCGQELTSPYSEWERIACHNCGVVATTVPRYTVGHGWGDFVNNKELVPNPKYSANKNVVEKDFLIGKFDFTGNCKNSIDNGIELVPEGTPEYFYEESYDKVKGNGYYGTGDEKNGFTATIPFNKTSGLTVSFRMMRDDSYAGNKYYGDVCSLMSKKDKDYGHFIELIANWGAIRLGGSTENVGRVGDRKWHHYAIVVRAAKENESSVVKLYVDGEERSEATVGGRTEFILKLGALFNDGAKGSFYDDVSIYSKELSVSQIKELGAVSEKLIPNVIKTYGGHHDAGDYNPRSHMEVSFYLMNAYELFPKKLGKKVLNIPENKDSVPDIINEALWGMRLWHAFYDDKTGAVRNGTESQGDPNFFQTVELDDKGDYAWAADSQGAFNYAAALAQAARLIRPYGKEKLANEYIRRAKKAYAWGKNNPPDTKHAEKHSFFYVCPMVHAAAQLYHTTGDKSYHEDFLKNVPWAQKANAEISVHRVYDVSFAAYAYLLLPKDMVDEAMYQKVYDAVKREADMYIWGSNQMAYKFIRHPYAPITWGTGAYQNYCLPLIHMMVHAKTSEERAKYKEWIIRTCDNTLGMNPLGISWITGLGSKTIRAPLHNSRYSIWGMPVKGLQAQGPHQNGDVYNYRATVYPAHDTEFAVMHSFIDCSFAISMDEVTVENQARSLSVFAALLPDLE